MRISSNKSGYDFRRCIDGRYMKKTTCGIAYINCTSRWMYCSTEKGATRSGMKGVDSMVWRKCPNKSTCIGCVDTAGGWVRKDSFRMEWGGGSLD